MSSNTMKDGILRVSKPEATLDAESETLRRAIALLDDQLEQTYGSRLKREPSLTRQLVSFQGNRTRSGYRWYKYKEAFSASLVEHFLTSVNVSGGTVLDPFAGSGTTLFAAADMGWNADGIELLPIGQEVIATRASVRNADASLLAEELDTWVARQSWKRFSPNPVPELRITKDAYPPETLDAIGRYLAALDAEKGGLRQLLTLLLLCVLESVSYTRKDGQYLRWDYRSGRRQGKKPFNKGTIETFPVALTAKANEIVADLRRADKSDSLFSDENGGGDIFSRTGSCLDILPTLETGLYDAVVTSPPYCNRYDYTRTYALELALLGTTEEQIRALRQRMLTCTVENRPKTEQFASMKQWEEATAIVDRQELLQTILAFLQAQKDAKKLNNNGIPRMVRGYFYEMACVLSECYRLLRTGGMLVMVNDNVRYCGENISVDLILSDIACSLGFSVRNILVLPGNKGNSSQQMGEHGRKPLRKCVYVWEK